jgi:hypothetical protein
MERRDAELVFALVREIGGDLRGRVIHERWWLVWIVMGVQIAITATLTQWLLWSGETRLERFAAVWGVHIALLPLIVAVIHRKGGGQRTATEQYIWRIWGTFLVCSVGVAALERITGLPLFTSAPILAVLSAFAFSMLAMVTHPGFLACGGYFLLTALAMACRPQEQILIFGLAWAALLLGLGAWFRAHRAPLAAERL